MSEKHSTADYILLFDWLSDMNEELDEMPDGAWQAMMQENVKTWNKATGKNFDPYDAFMMWVAHVGEEVTE